MSNSIDIRAIEDALYEWIDDETPSKTLVIFDKPNRDRPPLIDHDSYVTINLITMPTKMGVMDDSIKTEGSQTEYMIGGQRRASMSIICFGEDADQIITDLHASTEKESVRKKLRAAGIAIWEELPAQDISAELETGFETRHQFDVILGIASNIIETRQVFDTVETKQIVPDTESGIKEIDDTITCN